MLQLGWKAGTEQYPPDELLDYAMAAEEAGFDSIGASDHFHPWAEKGQASFGKHVLPQLRQMWQAKATLAGPDAGG